MEKILKIVDIAPAWSCENLDTLAPIDWEGFQIRLSDNTVKTVDTIPDMPIATEEERLEFFRNYYHFLYPGDVVEVYKGRKLPIGCRKTIKQMVEREVPGTYRHKFYTWVTFTDDTATDIKNIKLVNSDNLEWQSPRTIGLGGRL